MNVWSRLLVKVGNVISIKLLSSKSYWQLSRTLATHTGMTNAWLQSQGLISVRALWLKAHGYA